MQKYRFVINDSNEIIEIVESNNSVTHTENDLLITTLESAKLNFVVVGIDIQPILDFEETL